MLESVMLPTLEKVLEIGRQEQKGLTHTMTLQGDTITHGYVSALFVDFNGAPLC